MSPDPPRDPLPESSLALLTEGYEYASRRFQRFRSDVFEARLLMQRTMVITGREAVQVFYDGERFKREGAVPEPFVATMFGRGGVHGMDGAAHHQRKGMFMTFLTERAAERQYDYMMDELRSSLPSWQAAGTFQLFEEMERVIFRATCAWAGVPFEESEVSQRARDLGRTVVDAGSVSPKHFMARRARGRAERWAEGLIDRVRSGDLRVAPDSALSIVSSHPGEDGELLPLNIAAVELLNVIRPSVAVAHFVVFAALALLSYPEERRKLESGEVERHWFAQEVRRFYPFVPVLPAFVKQPFQWRGFHFPEGRRVLLDVHGVNRDPREWEWPDRFWPERFAQPVDETFTFIPQGGGEAEGGHRCPGEFNTVAIIEAALEFLVHEITYEVPPQDLRVLRSTFPGRPNSGLFISHVRPKEERRGV